MSQILVDAVITVPASSDDGDAGLSLQIQTLQGRNLHRVSVVKIIASDVQFGGQQTPNAHVTFSAATLGSIVTSGFGWAVVETDADGRFACTIEDAEIETVWFSACTADGGEDDADLGVVVRGCVPAGIEWEAPS